MRKAVDDMNSWDKPKQDVLIGGHRFVDASRKSMLGTHHVTY